MMRPLPRAKIIRTSSPQTKRDADLLPWHVWRWCVAPAFVASPPTKSRFLSVNLARRPTNKTPAKHCQGQVRFLHPALGGTRSANARRSNLPCPLGKFRFIPAPPWRSRYTSGNTGRTAGQVRPLFWHWLATFSRGRMSLSPPRCGPTRHFTSARSRFFVLHQTHRDPFLKFSALSGRGIGPRRRPPGLHHPPGEGLPAPYASFLSPAIAL